MLVVQRCFRRDNLRSWAAWSHCVSFGRVAVQGIYTNRAAGTGFPKCFSFHACLEYCQSFKCCHTNSGNKTRH